MAFSCLCFARVCDLTDRSDLIHTLLNENEEECKKDAQEKTADTGMKRTAERETVREKMEAKSTKTDCLFNHCLLVQF